MTRTKTNRNEVIRHLRLEQGLKLQTIGDMFGITRERVRQIVPGTVSINHVGIRAKIRTRAWQEANRHLTDAEVAESYSIPLQAVQNLRAGTQRPQSMMNRFMAIGWQGELEVADHMRALGFDVEKHGAWHQGADMTIGGKVAVDVKTRNTYFPYPNANGDVARRVICWPIESLEGRDFFVLYWRPDKMYWVIPAGRLAEYSFPTQLRFSYPYSKHGKRTQWRDYENRFDLIWKALGKEG